MTPRDLAAVIATLVDEARGRSSDPARPADPAPASVATVRPAGAGPSCWRTVALTGLDSDVRRAVVTALAARPEIARVRDGGGPATGSGPVDVELSPAGFAAALRALARASRPLEGATGADRGSAVGVTDPMRLARREGERVRLAQCTHARAVRRGVTARRCGVRPDVLAAAAGVEQLALVESLLDTEGALERSLAAREPVGGRRALAHLSSLALRAHAAFGAAASRPLGDRPVTAAHALALALDDAAAHGLARSLGAVGTIAPARL